MTTPLKGDKMAITNVTETVGPQDGDLITVQFEGAVARQFLAMLNMNKIIDHNGYRVVFQWRHLFDDQWTIWSSTNTD